MGLGGVLRRFDAGDSAGTDAVNNVAGKRSRLVTFELLAEMSKAFREQTLKAGRVRHYDYDVRRHTVRIRYCRRLRSLFKRIDKARRAARALLLAILWLEKR